MSPRSVLLLKKAHCFEGALLSAAAFLVNGEPPLLMDIKTTADDIEHVVALFKRYGRWGATSKTNHVVLRYREPVYKSPRELAMSYFHEYFLNRNGKKTMRSFSKPFDLRLMKKNWFTANENMWWLYGALDRSPHESILTAAMARNLRPADKIERQAGKIVEWKK